MAEATQEMIALAREIAGKIYRLGVRWGMCHRAAMGRLLCLFGLHKWHPTARIFYGYKVSKEMCARRCCGKRRWYV